MKKFIAAFDGLDISDSTVQYATSLASKSHAHLTGVFLDDFTHHSYKIYELSDAAGVNERKRDDLEYLDINKRAEAVEVFKKYCTDAEINFNIHSDRNFAIRDLLHESIYADLLFIDAKETFMNYQENQPTRFIRELLPQVQCPVMVVPTRFEQIEKLILLYDGEPSSVYAIRMLSYLLPCLKRLPIVVVTAQMKEEQLFIPDKRLMKEFMDRHFPTATYKILKGLPESVILEHLSKEKTNSLVVLGAYRRSVVSRWFRPSMASILMEKLRFPFFIAHT